MEGMWGSWSEERKTGRRWNCLKNNEMRWEIKRFERCETGEDIRREGGEMVRRKIWGRKEVKWRNKGVERGDYSRLVKEVRQSNTPSSRDSIEFEVRLCWRNDWWSGREWKGGKRKEDGQGMEVIEKTRWEGDKTVVAEGDKKDEERNGWNEESLKIIKFGKTRKDIRWKRGEFVVVEWEKQSESEDGGMKELREI